MEVPSPNIEQAMEAAAAAVPAEDDDQLGETMTVAEPAQAQLALAVLGQLQCRLPYGSLPRRPMPIS